MICRNLKKKKEENEKSCEGSTVSSKLIAVKPQYSYREAYLKR